MDNKLSIHFDEDKTKSIRFASKFKRKNIKKLYMKYRDIQIKQDSKMKYLGCLLEEIRYADLFFKNAVPKIFVTDFSGVKCLTRMLYFS